MFYLSVWVNRINKLCWKRWYNYLQSCKEEDDFLGIKHPRCVRAFKTRLPRKTKSSFSTLIGYHISGGGRSRSNGDLMKRWGWNSGGCGCGRTCIICGPHDAHLFRRACSYNSSNAIPQAIINNSFFFLYLTRQNKMDHNLFISNCMPNLIMVWVSMRYMRTKSWNDGSWSA